MSLFQRREKASQFTIVGNQAARDPNLSLKAKGLLLLMLSFSEGWTYRLGHIESLSADKAHATKMALHELMEVGYVLREKKRAEDGTFQWVYTVDDEPFAASSETTPQFSTDGLSTDGKSTPKKNKTRKPVKNTKELPSVADATGGQDLGELTQVESLVASVPPVAPPADSAPDGVAADAADSAPSSVFIDDVPATATAETEQAAVLEKVPGGAGAAAKAPSEHQQMMAAIREALYPGTERCADKLEARIAAASKQLRSAGLDVGAPAGILGHIRAQHAWRKFITPEHLIEHSAEWASQRSGHAAAIVPAHPAPARPVGRANTTAEAAQRSIDTASSVLAHIQNRRNSA